MILEILTKTALKNVKKAVISFTKNSISSSTVFSQVFNILHKNIENGNKSKNKHKNKNKQTKYHPREVS